MLMSHSMAAFNVYIRYRVTVETGRRLTPVHAVLGARQRLLRRASATRSTAAARPASTDLRRYDWTRPVQRRGSSPSAATCTAAPRTCGSRSRAAATGGCSTRAPFFGMPDHLYYRVRPILHEPGPIDTRYFLSQTGIPIRKRREDPR